MDNAQPEPPARKPRGVSLWTALIVVLVLAVFSLGVLGFVLYRATSDKAKLERQLQAWETERGQTELNRQKAEEQGRLAMAKTRQEECLVQIRHATNLLWTLRENLEAVKSEAAALRTNEAGRGVAVHPELVMLARRFYESDLRELPLNEIVISKLEAERRFELQLVSATGTSYQPDPTFLTSAQFDALWAAQESAKVQRAATLLRTLVDESKIKLPPANATNSVTLEAAIAEQIQADAAVRQRIVAEKTANAKDEAAKIVVAAEAQAIIEAAKEEAARIREEINAQAAKLRQEFALREAALKVEEAKVKVAVDEAADEARKTELRRKASDPEIQAKLASFLAKGYAQIGTGTEGLTTEKLPLRWSQMVAVDMISGSQLSLENLVILATTSLDKVRPRWRLKRQGKDWFKDTADYERAIEAQKLLRELGPTFVEMGLLRP